jgi:hypothetical protein
MKDDASESTDTLNPEEKSTGDGRILEIGFPINT